MLSGFTLFLADNICISPVHQCSKAAFTDMSYGSQTCCDWKDLYFGRTDQGRGEDVAEKRYPKHSPVNMLINNWQEYAKYYRTLILTRCSSLTRLIKHDQHHERKHRWRKQQNHLPLLPFLCQGDANLWLVGMMHSPLLLVCQIVGKVLKEKWVTKQERWKAQTYIDLVGNLMLRKRSVSKSREKKYLCTHLCKISSIKLIFYSILSNSKKERKNNQNQQKPK